MTKMPKVENLVQQFREDKPWSKAELARKAGVAPQTIAKMESFQPTNRNSQIKVAKALGKTLKEVFLP